jgi:hypothetical protein
MLSIAEDSVENIHPVCRNPRDVFHLDRDANPTELVFPICQPLHASRSTLLPASNVLGLAPRGPLQRLPGYGLLQQLRRENVISHELWSVTLLDSKNGILSIGSTIAKEVERAKLQGDLELQYLGDTTAMYSIEEEVNQKLAFSMFDSLPLEAHFKWINLQGASGWWTSLMTGVWVNDAKILKNQPILLDIQCPFILAPPAAVTRFYGAIGGAIRLPAPFDSFFAYPCLNNVYTAFDLGGWRFNSMHGDGVMADALYGPAGGRFSLGKMQGGTGYCVGSVVETRMGAKQKWSDSGMLDTWVLGEPFFRGLGLVFDSEGGRVGVRSY